MSIYCEHKKFLRYYFIACLLACFLIVVVYFLIGLFLGYLSSLIWSNGLLFTKQRTRDIISYYEENEGGLK